MKMAVGVGESKRAVVSARKCDFPLFFTFGFLYERSTQPGQCAVVAELVDAQR